MSRILAFLSGVTLVTGIELTSAGHSVVVCVVLFIEFCSICKV